MFTSILVPIDGTAESNVSLPLARVVARDTGASITVLRVLSLPEWPRDRDEFAAATDAEEVAVPIPLSMYAGYECGGITDVDPAWDEEALASARAYVDGIVTRLRGRRGLVVDGETRLAPDVAETIVTVADEASADLIVMSTQALTGTARALLGSVADAVVRGGHCPVLLVHRADADQVATQAKEKEATHDAGVTTGV
jgi:nucleotide-binding universal stress UspA family protein